MISTEIYQLTLHHENCFVGVRMLAKGESEDLRETLLEAVSLAREQIDEFDERAALLDEQDFDHRDVPIILLTQASFCTCKCKKPLRKPKPFKALT